MTDVSIPVPVNNSIPKNSLTTKQTLSALACLLSYIAYHVLMVLSATESAKNNKKMSNIYGLACGVAFTVFGFTIHSVPGVLGIVVSIVYCVFTIMSFMK
jgi:hypothetical protein